jgi:replicative DNA helicase
MQNETERDISQEKLDDYGYNFIVKLLRVLIHDFELYYRIHQILEPEHFTNFAAKNIYLKISDYFSLYGTLPNMDNLKTMIMSETDDNRKEQLLDFYNDMAEMKMNFNEDKSVYDAARGFCERQNMHSALLKCVDLHFHNRNYNAILEEIEQSLIKNNTADVGIIGFKDIRAMLANIRSNIVPTGFSALDTIINGGVGGHELAILFGPYGSGKSHWLVAIACNALRMGYNVLFYTLENSRRVTNARFMSNFTQVDMDTILKDSSQHERIEQIVTKLKEENNWGNFVIQEFPSSGTTLNDLKMHRKKLKYIGFEPQIILIDYLDLLSPIRERGQTYTDQGKVTVELRSWSQEEDVPIWTVTQSNKESLDAVMVIGSMMADSMGKNRGVDLLMTLSNKNILFLDKSRLGEDKIAFDITKDTGTSTFELGFANKEKAEQILSGEITNKFTKQTPNKSKMMGLLDEV